MQYNDCDIIIEDFREKLRGNFGDKMSSISIFGQTNEPFIQFHMEFTLYNFYNIILNYERGRFGCAIIFSEKNGISLSNSQKWYDKADLNIFAKELDMQVRLRIPDKYLKQYGDE
ncbi:MAG: hypothetical protein RR646_07950 [Erysipelotrichaceae bacterium]